MANRSLVLDQIIKAIGARPLAQILGHVGARLPANPRCPNAGQWPARIGACGLASMGHDIINEAGLDAPDKDRQKLADITPEPPS